MASTDDIPTSEDPAVVGQGGSSNFFNSAKRAYATGMEGAHTRVKQAGGAVRGGAQKATETSKAFMSTMAGRVDEYKGKAHKKAVDYHGNISRAVAAGRTGDGSEGGEPVKFPLSIITWCTSLCGSKKSRARELAPESEGLVEQERTENPDPVAAPTYDDATTAAPA